MDSQYILGISELDAQHEDLERVFLALQDAIRDKARWAEIPEILREIHEKLVRHFSFEESVMQLSSYPEAFEHKKAHQQILSALARYEEMEITPTSIESLGKPALQLFYDQILLHDRRFSRFMEGHKDRLGIN